MTAKNSAQPESTIAVIESESSSLTTTQLRYLTELYLIIRNTGMADDELVTTSVLSDVMQEPNSNTSRMIERLREQQMLHHVPYQGVCLTPQGKAHALSQLRKRRIINAFLMTVMGLAWHEIYDEARRIETATDQTLLHRMWSMAGKPLRDPFGERIDMQDNNNDDIRLTEAKVKEKYRISRVAVRIPDRLQYLDALGLRPSVPFELLSHAPFDGPLQIKIGREYRILGHDLARVIWVTDSA